MSKLVPKLRFKEFSGEWEKKRLDEIIDDFIVPMRDKPKDLTGDIPWCRIEDFDGIYLSKSKSNQGVTEETVKSMNLKVYPKNTLLVSCSADLGRCAIVKNKLVTNQTFIGLKPKSTEDVRFLYYLMSYSRDRLNALSTGTTISYLSRQEFEKFEINIPSLNEQKKIAHTLSSLDALIEAQNKKVEALQKHKKALMQQMFPKKGEKTPKLRFKEFSGEWEEKKIDDTGDIVTGTTPSTKIYKYYEGGIYPWVTPTDITEKKNITETKKLLTQEGLKVGRYIPPNSLLVTCIASIGKNVILREKGSCNQQINAVIPYEDFNVDFLYYLIENNNHILLENAGQGGMAMLNKNDFSNLVFLFPKPEEQQKIANTLSSLDALIEAQHKKVEALQKHKKALMQQMFVGDES